MNSAALRKGGVFISLSENSRLVSPACGWTFKTKLDSKILWVCWYSLIHSDLRLLGVTGSYKGAKWLLGLLEVILPLPPLLLGGALSRARSRGDPTLGMPHFLPALMAARQKRLFLQLWRGKPCPREVRGLSQDYTCSWCYMTWEIMQSLQFFIFTSINCALL